MSYTRYFARARLGMWGSGCLPQHHTWLRLCWFVPQPVGIELYSHVGDTGVARAAFDSYENVNLAGNPACVNMMMP